MLAGNIQNARKRAGLTQQELADLIGVGRPSLASWETRRAKPDIDDFMKLCRSLRTKPDDLYGLAFDYALADFQQPVVDLAKILANLPPAVFSMVSKMIRSLDGEIHGGVPEIK